MSPSSDETKQPRLIRPDRPETCVSPARPIVVVHEDAAVRAPRLLSRSSGVTVEDPAGRLWPDGGHVPSGLIT